LAEHTNPRLIDSPLFVTLIEAMTKAAIMERHEAGEALAQAQQPPVQLESGAGAGGSLLRDQGAREIDRGERVVKAAERLRPRI
jgi:hypothetical protein